MSKLNKSCILMIAKYTRLFCILNIEHTLNTSNRNRHTSHETKIHVVRNEKSSYLILLKILEHLHLLRGEVEGRWR